MTVTMADARERANVHAKLMTEAGYETFDTLDGMALLMLGLVALRVSGFTRSEVLSWVETILAEHPGLRDIP